jgi:hypothetical protein
MNYQPGDRVALAYVAATRRADLEVVRGALDDGEIVVRFPTLSESGNPVDRPIRAFYVTEHDLRRIP